jgi:DNA invertase Pin-like site-specific DNA recombinase
MGRNLKHLVTLLDEWRSLGVDFVSLAEGIDRTTPAGKLHHHILAAMAEFERGRIQERVRAGMARAKANGKHIGRRRQPVTDDAIASVAHLSLRQAADRLGVSKSFLASWRASRRVSEPVAVNA